MALQLGTDCATAIKWSENDGRDWESVDRGRDPASFLRSHFVGRILPGVSTDSLHCVFAMYRILF